jgi:RNA recognition motif-containing protein
MKNIYVGNLSFQTNEDTVRQLFEQYGEVSSVKLISDRETGRPRGFGFVEMPNDSEGDAAIEATNGMDLEGRNLRVNEARPRESRPPRRGGGGGGGGFGGGGRGRY